MAEITFHANQNGMASSDDATLIEHAGGSGLGFFGGGFGISVPVGQYQDTSYVTNGDGTASGVRVNNTKWASSNVIPNSGVSANGGATIGLSGMPNYYAPLRISFSHSEAVKVQNCKLRIFDRSNINNHASGVTTKVYEVRRPHPVKNGFAAGQGALKLRGDVGDHKWNTWDHEEDASVADMNFTPSPGPSGLNTSSDDPIAETESTYRNWISKSGEACRAKRHDWYVAISASPNEIGSKTDFGMYFTVEYL